MIISSFFFPSFIIVSRVFERVCVVFFCIHNLWVLSALFLWCCKYTICLCIVGLKDISHVLWISIYNLIFIDQFFLFFGWCMFVCGRENVWTWVKGLSSLKSSCGIGKTHKHLNIVLAKYLYKPSCWILLYIWPQ